MKTLVRVLGRGFVQGRGDWSRTCRGVVGGVLWVSRALLGMGSSECWWREMVDWNGYVVQFPWSRLAHPPVWAVESD